MSVSKRSRGGTRYSCRQLILIRLCPVILNTDFLSPLNCSYKADTLVNFLFASVVQNLVELLQLPGLGEDRAFQKEIGLKTLVFKAYR